MESASPLTRRDRKKQETKQKIVKIAMYLFRKQGYGSTTMEQIAEEVDISKATLYNYYPVKESIISTAWQVNVKELKFHILEMIQLLPDTKSRIQKTFIKAATELFKSKQDIYKIYLNYWLSNLNNPALQDRLRSGFEDIFSMIIRLGQQSGDVRKDIAPELLAKHLEINFLIACISWLNEPKLFPLEKTLTQTVSLFIEGAGAGARRSKARMDDSDFSQESLL